MPRTDFNGDGFDDIFWSNYQSNTAANWQGQAGGQFFITDSEDMPGQLIGIGDYDGDGRSDTLWRMNGGGVSVSYTYPEGAFYFQWSNGHVQTVPYDWYVVGTGDFNGDGRDDVMWRNYNGALTNWLSLGNYEFANNQANITLSMANNWYVVGTGDFNGDGRDDLLWRQEISGTVTAWLGQANGGFTSIQASFAPAIPEEWMITGIGDFNGDGRSDILWRHMGLGTVTNWLAEADGGFINNHPNTGEIVPLDWMVAATGDYNHDGRDDILWRNLENGIVTSWIGESDGGFANNPITYFQPSTWWAGPNPSGSGYWDY